MEISKINIDSYYFLESYQKLNYIFLFHSFVNKISIKEHLKKKYF